MGVHTGFLSAAKKYKKMIGKETVGRLIMTDVKNAYTGVKNCQSK